LSNSTAEMMSAVQKIVVDNRIKKGGWTARRAKSGCQRPVEAFSERGGRGGREAAARGVFAGDTSVASRRGSRAIFPRASLAPRASRASRRAGAVARRARGARGEKATATSRLDTITSRRTILNLLPRGPLPEHLREPPVQLALERLTGHRARTRDPGRADRHEGPLRAFPNGSRDVLLG
jgi:hypothetical protein